MIISKFCLCGFFQYIRISFVFFFFLSYLVQVSDLYSTDGSYTTDPWVPHAAHYGSYAHAAHAHAAQAHAYHHNMAQYGSLLRLPQHYGHSSRLVWVQGVELHPLVAFSKTSMQPEYRYTFDPTWFFIWFQPQTLDLHDCIFSFFFPRLHHDQQAAHALESAAAYSSYPTMAGEYNRKAKKKLSFNLSAYFSAWYVCIEIQTKTKKKRSHKQKTVQRDNCYICIKLKWISSKNCCLKLSTIFPKQKRSDNQLNYKSPSKIRSSQA